MRFICAATEWSLLCRGTSLFACRQVGLVAKSFFWVWVKIGVARCFRVERMESFGSSPAWNVELEGATRWIGFARVYDCTGADDKDKEVGFVHKGLVRKGDRKFGRAQGGWWSVVRQLERWENES